LLARSELGEAAAECSAATRETYAALHLAGMAFCLGADDRISAVINRSLGRPDGV